MIKQYHYVILRIVSNERPFKSTSFLMIWHIVFFGLPLTWRPSSIWSTLLIGASTSLLYRSTNQLRQDSTIFSTIDVAIKLKQYKMCTNAHGRMCGLQLATSHIWRIPLRHWPMKKDRPHNMHDNKTQNPIKS